MNTPKRKFTNAYVLACMNHDEFPDVVSFHSSMIGKLFMIRHDKAALTSRGVNEINLEEIKRNTRFTLQMYNEANGTACMNFEGGQISLPLTCFICVIGN